MGEKRTRNWPQEIRELLMGMENGLEVCLAVGMLGNDSSMKNSHVEEGEKEMGGKNLSLGALCGLCGQSLDSVRGVFESCIRLKEPTCARMGTYAALVW